MQVVSRHPTDRRLSLLAMALDVVAIVLFAALGRRSHDEDSGVLDVLETAAPFLIALAVGWLVVLVARLAPTSIVAGFVVWAVTVVGGLVLRRTVWDRGTQPSFIIVAALVLGLLLVVWRTGVSVARSRGEVRSAPPPPEAGR